MQPRSWPGVLAYSGLAGLLYQWCFVGGIRQTTAGNTALILASIPMWTAILSGMFAGEKFSHLTWGGLAVTFLGTLIVTLDRWGVSLESQYFVGNLLMVAAAMLWGGASVLSRPLLEEISPTQLAFWSGLLTLPVQWIIAWPYVRSSLSTWSQPQAVWATVFSGMFSTGLAYIGWHVGVRGVGAAYAAVYQNLVTLVALLGGWVFFAEIPSAVQFLGGGLTILGLFMMRRGRPKNVPRLP